MTIKRDLFPGAGLPAIVGGLQTLSEADLLSKLKRAVSLYKDPSLRERDLFAIKGLGEVILSCINELRRRGFEIVENEDTICIHTKATVDILRPGGAIEILDEHQAKCHVYWRLSNFAARMASQGNKRLYNESIAALAFLYKHWHVREVCRLTHQIRFEGEPPLAPPPTMQPTKEASRK
jgi:hypothetical protein